MLHYKKCVKCGTRFGTVYPSKIYSADSCHYANVKKRYLRKCRWCGKEFEAHDRRKVFCCHPCGLRARTKNYEYEHMLNRQIEKTEQYLNMAIEKLAYYKKMREEYERTKQIPSWKGVHQKNPLESECVKTPGIKLSQSKVRRERRWRK